MCINQIYQYGTLTSLVHDSFEVVFFMNNEFECALHIGVIFVKKVALSNCTTLGPNKGLELPYKSHNWGAFIYLESWNTSV